MVRLSRVCVCVYEITCGMPVGVNSPTKDVIILREYVDQISCALFMVRQKYRSISTTHNTNRASVIDPTSTSTPFAPFTSRALRRNQQEAPPKWLACDWPGRVVSANPQTSYDIPSTHFFGESLKNVYAAYVRPNPLTTSHFSPKIKTHNPCVIINRGGDTNRKRYIWEPPMCSGGGFWHRTFVLRENVICADLFFLCMLVRFVIVLPRTGDWGAEFF